MSPSRGVPWLSDIMPDQAWKGERCFVIGGGPSLVNFDWDILKGAGRVIAVNRAIEKVPWADIMFSMDSRLYQWYHEQRNKMSQESLDAYDNFKGLKVWLDSHCYHFQPDIHMVRWLGRSGVSLSLERGIYSGGNSGYSALMLAVALGCSPIILLGYDMGHEGGRTHWHNGYPAGSCNPLTRTWIQVFEDNAKKIKDAGIKVINANQNSNIRCFPFGRVVGHPQRTSTSRQFIVCSFYTLDYMESAMRLREQLENLGLDYHLQKVGRTSLTYIDWQRETFFKASFVRNMMNQYPDKDIVWVDADAEIREYPEMFNDFPGNLGARIYRGQKLLSGTVYFKNTPEIRTLVDDWICENQRPQDKFRCQQEQMNLQEVIERSNGKVKFVNLPQEYCHIFDEKEKCERPIIVHNQHSRKFRGKNAPN